jgi:hypothetical protein
MKSLLIIGAVLTSAAAMPALAQEHGSVEVASAARHDVLPSLRDVVPQKDGYSRWHFRAEHMIPLPAVPPGQTDGAVQSTTARALRAGAAGRSTASEKDSAARMDRSPFVGAARHGRCGRQDPIRVQIVNDGLAVFDKTEDQNVVYGPVPTNTPWVGSAAPARRQRRRCRRRLRRLADRWIISQFAVASTPYFQCVAVADFDATGAYNRYAFSCGSAFPDYPKMGVWPGRVLRNVQHVHRQLVHRLEAVCVRSHGDARQQRRSTTVFPVDQQLRRRAAVRSRRTDAAARVRRTTCPSSVRTRSICGSFTSTGRTRRTRR